MHLTLLNNYFETIGSIPLGDKSTPEDIGSYFHGISKKDFKNAIGSLYREGLVAQGGLITSLVPDENRKVFIHF